MIFLFYFYFYGFFRNKSKNNQFYLCLLIWPADVTLWMRRHGIIKENISLKNFFDFNSP